MITEQVLIKNGYKKHTPDIFHKGSLNLFQKRIDDHKGKQYFINIYQYGYKDIPNYPYPDKIDWQAEVQFCLPDNKTCNVEYFGNLEDVDEIKMFFYKMWHRMGIFEYYELF